MILPRENQRDLADIDPVVRQSLRFVPVDDVGAVLAEALCPVQAQPPQKEETQAVPFLVSSGTVKENPLCQ